MNYTLRGGISRTQPYQLDPTLTVEGAGAEAKATGEAIKKVQNEAKSHYESTSNPHSVTKEQVGLGLVDNTSDMEKPVSYAQEKAIAEAKKAGTDAYNHAEEAMTAAGNAQTSAAEAKTAADNAQTSADEAKNVAQEAKATVTSKTAWFTKTVTLSSGGWSSYEQTVSVPGVTDDKSQPIIIAPATPESFYEYSTYGVKPSKQGVDTLTFSCEYTPTADITLDVLGFTVPA